MSENKILATHQPNYIPWLGYFFKISQCDIFVYLDDVQFSKKGAHNYHYIKTPEGSVKLKIPVKHAYTDPINKVITNDHGGWKQRHLDLLETTYREAPHFDEVMQGFKPVLLQDYPNLSELNKAIIQWVVDQFGIKTEFVCSSELDINTKSEERILDICTKLGATVYYSGKGAKAYQNEENFTARGLELVYDHYSPKPYPQMHEGFQENVTILDYLMNCGFDWQYIADKYK